MDSFDVVISPKALRQLDSYIDYIQNTLLNDQAAREVWADALETRARLAEVAGSLSLCEHPLLNQLGYRVIRFARHRYVMLYRVEGGTAYVDAVYHELQDYENTFSKRTDQV